MSNQEDTEQTKRSYFYVYYGTMDVWHHRVRANVPNDRVGPLVSSPPLQDDGLSSFNQPQLISAHHREWAATSPLCSSSC